MENRTAHNPRQGTLLKLRAGLVVPLPDPKILGTLGTALSVGTGPSPPLSGSNPQPVRGHQRTSGVGAAIDIGFDEEREDAVTLLPANRLESASTPTDNTGWPGWRTTLLDVAESGKDRGPSIGFVPGPQSPNRSRNLEPRDKRRPVRTQRPRWPLHPQKSNSAVERPPTELRAADALG